MNWVSDMLAAFDLKNILALISAIAFFMAALAALIAILRIDKVWQALREFHKARDNLSELIGAIDRLEDVVPKLRTATSDIQEEVSDLKRTKTPAPGNRELAAPESRQAAAEEGRWQEVRTSWRDIRDALERIIDNLDGRVRRPYNVKSRNNYTEVISMLTQDEQISQRQGNAAQQMNKRFLQLRPRNTNVTEEDVTNFKRWEKEFVEGSRSAGGENGPLKADAKGPVQ